MSAFQAEWMNLAACRSSDPDLFFGLDGERGEVKATREAAAKAVCASCIARYACRQFALDHPRWTGYGVWGGIGEDERVRERANDRRRERRAAGDVA